MKVTVATLPQDVPALTAVAEAAFSATSDAQLSDWFSFAEMEKMVTQHSTAQDSKGISP